MLKEEFRKKQKMLLKRYTKNSFSRDFIIFKTCLKLIKTFKAKKILIYLALPYEPKLCRFRRIFSKNCKLFVPFMVNESLKIVKLRLPLEKKRFGVLETNNSFLNTKIDMAIVPVIGIDKEFKRIGHGKGFYDRFFKNLNYKPIMVFVGSLNAISKKELGQSYDITGNFYINSYKKYHRKEKNANKLNCTFNRNNRNWGRILSC